MSTAPPGKDDGDSKKTEDDITHIHFDKNTFSSSLLSFLTEFTLMDIAELRFWGCRVMKQMNALCFDR